VAARYTWIELRPRHLSIVAVVLVVVALPAAAHASYFRIVNHETSWCLEADMAGDAYLNPCAPDNALQVWERWDGGWTRNLATGLCLRGEGQFSPGSIHAAPCVWNDPRANWLHWYGGWYQRAEFVAGGVTNAAECMSRVAGSHDVTGIACVNPNGPNPDSEEWFATETPPPGPAPSPTAPAPPDDPCGLSPVASGVKVRARFPHSGRVATVDYGRHRRVNGRLQAADGSPIGGATLCVGVQTSERGRVRAAGSVVTDANGRFSFRLGPGASRRIWFVHRAGGVSAAAAVVVRVRAPVRVRASSRSLRNGQTLVLRGRLGGHLRTRGLLVEFQVRRGRSWSTFATSRTVRAGRFRYAYRFTRTFGVQTYRFRARLPAQRGSPFSTGSSRRVTVRVVG
jgi:hypothetical protein